MNGFKAARLWLWFIVLYTIFLAVLVFIDDGFLEYLTRWNLLYQVVYFVFSLFLRALVCATPMMFIAVGLVYMVAFGIVGVLWQNYYLMAQAEDEYGVIEAQVGNALLHFIQPIILSLDIWIRYTPQWYSPRHLTIEHYTDSAIVGFAMFILYAALMDPAARYYTTVSRGTFCALLMMGFLLVNLAFAAVGVYLQRYAAAAASSSSRKAQPISTEP